MGSTQGAPSSRIGYLAWQVTHVMGARLERVLRSLDLTTAQHNALQHLVWTPGISAAEMARRTGFTPQSMGAAVNELVVRGLLVRCEDPADRRTVHLVITDKGAELAERARDAVGRLDGEVLAVLTPAERSVVHSLLYRMLAELNPAALPPMDPRDPASGAIPSHSAVPARWASGVDRRAGGRCRAPLRPREPSWPPG